MTLKTSILFTLFLLLNCSVLRATEADYQSTYVGEEHREIKSMSDDDLDALKNGGGWGLAKAAELNGLPGPLHVLQMGGEIELSSEQTLAVQAIYDAMKSRAIEIGLQMIDLEAELDGAFARGEIDQESLERQVTEISRLRGQLRYVHLAAHLETPKVLTESQIRQYNDLRGYSSDPCERVPTGHDADLWLKHNGCQ